MDDNSKSTNEKTELLPRVKTRPEESENHLDRSLSTMNGIFIMLGIFIGSGVFVSPGIVVKRVPNLFVALLIWAICGLVIILAMGVAIELGCLFPRPGSHYVYIQKTLGRVPAFMYIWSYATIVTPAGMSVLLNAMGRYATQPFLLTAVEAVWISKVIGAIVMILLCIVNSFGIRVIAKCQYAFTGIQVAIVFLLVAMGIWHISSTGDFSHFEPTSFFNNTDELLNGNNLGDIGKAMYNTFWAYDGWMLVSSLTEEFVNPQKSLPIVAFSSSIFTILIYIVLNMAYFAVLSKNEMSAVDTVGIALVQKVAGKKAAMIMPILVALSILGSVNAIIIGVSRTYLSAARDGSMPRLLTLIHRKQKSPMIIIWFVCASSLLWLFIVETTEDLIQYFNSGYWVFYGMAILGCLIYKFKAKDLHRPYKTYVTTPIFLCIVTAAVVVSGFVAQPVGTGICWVWILLSLVVYYVLIHKNFKFCNIMSVVGKILEERLNMVPCK